LGERLLASHHVSPQNDLSGAMLCRVGAPGTEKKKKSHAETATDAVRLVTVCTPSHCRKVPTSRIRYRNGSWRRFRICCEIVRSQFLECGRALPFVPGGYRSDTSGSVCILHQGRQGLRECCCIRTVSCLKLGSPSCSKIHVACKRTDENALA
jgi:hypothetical protein